MAQTSFSRFILFGVPAAESRVSEQRERRLQKGKWESSSLQIWPPRFDISKSRAVAL